MGLPINELGVIPLNGMEILAIFLEAEHVGGRFRSDHENGFANGLPLVVIWVLSIVNLVK